MESANHICRDVIVYRIMLELSPTCRYLYIEDLGPRHPKHVRSRRRMYESTGTAAERERERFSTALLILWSLASRAVIQVSLSLGFGPLRIHFALLVRVLDPQNSGRLKRF